MNCTDIEAVPEEMHDSRTQSLPSYAHLQNDTTLQLPTSTSRASEWKVIWGITTNKKPDAEYPQTDFERADG